MCDQTPGIAGLTLLVLSVSIACAQVGVMTEPEQDASSNDANAETDAIDSSNVATGDASMDAGDSGPVIPLEPGPCDQVRVDTDGRSANVRALPTTSSDVVGALPYGAKALLIGQAAGETLDGRDAWYRVQTDNVQGFIFSSIVECSEEGEVHKGFVLPFECGKTTFVSQANFGSWSHTGIHEYAYDFRVAIGDPLYAMAPGKVTALYNGTKPGHPCYNGGDTSCINDANYVIIDHPDGTEILLAHLSDVAVTIGQTVEQGELVGFGGNTGFSGNPHVHVARRTSCCQSIPLTFLETEDGQPEYLENVTSANCPVAD